MIYPPPDEIIQRAVEYIDANCHRHISVDELAALCNLSASHFYSRFRKAMGCAPIEYKNRAAIQRAQRMLNDDAAMSIEEIGLRNGFESASYFRRVFRAVAGMTPSEYRATGDLNN